jgi:type IV pilus assembly protein PilC
MPTQHYRFQARNARGELVAGTLVADSVAGAAQAIRARGDHVVQLVPVAAAGDDLRAALKRFNYSSGPSQKDILDFTTQLAVMIRAGISIRAALEGIAEQVQNQKFRRILMQIKADVESGKQFSDAIARHPKLFGPLYVNMVKASEMSGSFAKMLDRIAAYLAQEIETRKMVVGASIYPGIIALMAISTTVFLLTFVLPRCARRPSSSWRSRPSWSSGGGSS